MTAEEKRLVKEGSKIRKEVIKTLKKRAYYKSSTYEAKKDLLGILKQCSPSRAQEILQKLDDANIKQVAYIWGSAYNFTVGIRPTEGEDRFSIKI